MKNHSENQPYKQMPAAEPPAGTREQATAALFEASFNLKGRFIRAGHHLISVKEQLEDELHWLKNNYPDQPNHRAITKKNSQIDAIIRFFNECEEIIGDYQQLFRIIKIHNAILESALNGAVINQQEIRKSFLNLND